jgi:O-antigen/teichoic acid export membrane protein
MANSFISGTMSSVAQPVFSNAGDDLERQKRIFRKMLRFASFLSFPLMLGLALVAREFILLTVGPKWEPCVPLLQILCIGGAFLPHQLLYQNFVISRGRSDFILYLVTLQILLQIGITLCLASKGITFMVTAFSTLNVCFTICWHYALRRVCPLSILAAMKDIFPFVLISLGCMIFTYYSTLWSDNLWLRFFLRVIIAALLYLGTMKLLNVRTLEECIHYISSQRH